MVNVLAENIVDICMPLLPCKEMWEALEEKFSVFDASSELYVMEQLYDYKIVDNRFVVE